jgi:putative ABC transport system permease protein
MTMLPFGSDLKHALLRLRTVPALSAVCVLSLALGIGANVTIYSVVREMVLDDLSARQPGRLVNINSAVPYGRYRELRQAGVFQDLAFGTGIGNDEWETGTHSEVVWRIPTSANFFDVLGVSALVGRLYSQSDEGRPVAVVSYGFWRKRLGADPAAIGRPLRVAGNSYTLVGVLPRDYRSIMRRGVSPEIYLMAPANSRRCHLFGRLRDGVTAQQTRDAWVATARILGGQEFARQISTLTPMAGLAANAAGQGDDRRFFVFFVMLFVTALLLAIISCVNVAGLLLARGVTRQRELAIRTALGASRLQLARQLLTEGMILVSFGAAAGLIIDAWLRNRLSYLRWPSAYNLPFEFHFQSDRGLFLYALAAAFLALLFSSLLPALRGSHADLGLAMKQSEPAFSMRRWGLRNSFVTLQVALSMVLLTLGVLFARSFRQVADVDPGFDVAHMVMTTVWDPPGQNLTGEARWIWRDGVVRRIQEVPGVMGVTSIGTLPFMGELPAAQLRRKGEPAAAARDVYSEGAGEQFCKVLGIPILRGRDFQISDRSRQPVPVLINQTLARQLFGSGDPIGAQLLDGREGEGVFEIIGVTADTKMRTLGEGLAPIIFTPYAESQLLVRVAGDAAQWVGPLGQTLGQMENSSAMDVRPLSEAAAGAMFPMRVAAGFVGSLSGLGLLLALSGIYSSVSYATRPRTRELAIRSAVGANGGAILWTTVKDALTVLACGVLAGLPLAIATIRPLTDILPNGLNPWHPVMFAAVAFVLMAAGAAAAWIPAWAAGSVDPALVLRQE